MVFSVSNFVFFLVSDFPNTGFSIMQHGMGTCQWARFKICNLERSGHLVGISFCNVSSALGRFCLDLVSSLYNNIGKVCY